MHGLQTIDVHAQKAIKVPGHYSVEENTEHKLPRTRKIRFDNQLEIRFLLISGKEKSRVEDTNLTFCVNL